MSYSEKLRDPRWQRRRLEILERDCFTCVECRREDLELHVHHIRYIRGRDPWDYPEELLVTLCAECHDRIHAGEPLGYEALGNALSKRGCNGMIAHAFVMLLDESLPPGEILKFEDWKQLYQTLEDAARERAKRSEKNDA